MFWGRHRWIPTAFVIMIALFVAFVVSHTHRMAQTRIPAHEDRHLTDAPEDLCAAYRLWNERTGETVAGMASQCKGLSR